MKTYNNKWIKAEEGPEKNSVIYTDADGNQLTRFWKAYEGQPDNEASTRSWRNNNPGNHAIGTFAKKKERSVLQEKSLTTKVKNSGLQYILIMKLADKPKPCV